MSDYQEFLQTKLTRVIPSGFAPSNPIHPLLFDWQAEITNWALIQGKAALFEECGLGKTLQQVEWAKHVMNHTGGRVLILSPLAVAHQTVAEGLKIDVPITYIRDEEKAIKPGIYITNYDMLKDFVGDIWDGVVLDESSILKNFTGQTKRMILNVFERTPYKLACTATPAPNDHLELGNHAEFLSVMPSNEMIQRWFINDSMAAGSYRLKKHAEKDYWKWVTSWAVCISKPSDIGYPDETDRYTFDMPPLTIHNEVVGVDHSRAWESGKLIVDGTLSATEMWKEKRATLKDRCARAREIVTEDEPWVIWCDTNDEADVLMKLFPDAIEVRGNQSIKEKEQKINDFTDGRVSKIISKPDICGYGLNWQHCPNQVFVGVTYSFEKTYQALRRSWRFGQTQEVNAWMISAESEGDLVKALAEKQELHSMMQSAMNEAMREHGLGALGRKIRQPYTPNLPMQLPEWL